MIWFSVFFLPGGNAGYAAAYAARQLGLPATVVIPESTTKFMADKLRELGAEVIVHGKVGTYTRGNNVHKPMVKLSGASQKC